MVFSILLANPKGGSGKSTLATQLAGYLAQAGYRTALGDTDRQHTTRAWLGMRPATLPPITAWDTAADDDGKPPKGTQVVVLDSPANLHGKKLSQLLARVDRVIVPVQPSPFDLWASEAFFATLAEEKAIRKAKAQLGVVGMRVNRRTRAAQQLDDFFARLDFPVLATLRETQLYPQTASQGLSLFDWPASKTRRDRTEWQPLLDWLALPPQGRFWE